MPELTRAMIDEGMARAEKIACRPSDDRCYAFPDPLEDTRKTCTPEGQCRIGWILANTGRDSWDVWLDGHTGEGRLRRQARAGRPHRRSKRIRNAGLGRVCKLDAAGESDSLADLRTSAHAMSGQQPGRRCMMRRHHHRSIRRPGGTLPCVPSSSSSVSCLVASSSHHRSMARLRS